jgi:hypothetical protein
MSAIIRYVQIGLLGTGTTFPSTGGDGKGTPRPRNSVRHFVETSGRPVFAKAHRLDPDKLVIA